MAFCLTKLSSQTCFASAIAKKEKKTTREACPELAVIKLGG